MARGGITSTGTTRHQSVLYEEALAWLAPRDGGRYIDGTVNGGGHATGILERSSPGGLLLGLDADPAAIDRARASLAEYGARVRLRQANFRDLEVVAHAEAFGPAQGILLDLGVSSDTFEQAGRGFSFRRDEPLDMRFDPSGGRTAAELLADSTEAELRRLLAEYGEEPAAGRLARALVRARAESPLQTSGQLAALVERILGRSRAGDGWW